MIRSTRYAAAIALVGCGQDSSFTKLLELEPSGTDTSTPPMEVEEASIPEPAAECPERIFAAQVTTVREDCRIEPPTFRYTPVVEWQISTWDDFPTATQHGASPVVGQFTDDNADGMIGSGDIPDVLLLSLQLYPAEADLPGNALRLVSGDGTAVHWSRNGWTVADTTLRVIEGTTPALADLDADGTPEIVVVLGPDGEGDSIAEFETFIETARHNEEQACHVAVLDAEGAIELVNLEAPVSCMGHSPLVADVQGDGEVDIVVGTQTFRSSDLLQIGAPYNHGTARLGVGTDPTYWNGGIPVVADLDGNGTMELITGTHIQEWDGAVRCTTGAGDGWPAVADLDGDGSGDIVISTSTGGRGGLLILDENCDLVRAWRLDDLGLGGPPTIADYDGDGVPEIGLAARTAYLVYESDGTLKWTNPASDNSSNCTGSSVFDFEEDGYAEVVYADETDLWVISGHSGDFVMRWAGHSSWTANEYPIVVDVDADGEAEIVVTGSHGIAVIGAEEGWAPARQVWNQHAYWITNVNDDLTIPSPTPQNWPEYNSFRSGDLRVNAGQGARLVDAKPFMHDICEVECGEGTVEVALSPNNEGLADAVDGVNLAVYAEQTDGSRVLIEVLTPEDLHRSGYATEGVVLELAMTDLPTGTLILVADDDGTGTGVIEECDETNNELRLEGLCSDE